MLFSFLLQRLSLVKKRTDQSFFVKIFPQFSLLSFWFLFYYKLYATRHHSSLFSFFILFSKFHFTLFSSSFLILFVYFFCSISTHTPTPTYHHFSGNITFWLFLMKSLKFIKIKKVMFSLLLLVVSLCWAIYYYFSSFVSFCLTG